MDSVLRVDVSLMKDKRFHKAVEISQVTWSYYFSLGYSLLKAVIRLKPFPGIVSPARHMESCLNRALALEINENLLEYIKTFKNMLVRFEQLSDISQCFKDLENYLSSSELLNSILYGAYYICAVIIEDVQISSHKFFLVQEFAKVSHLTIKVFSNDENFLFRNPNKETGALINLLYEKVENQHKLSYLIQDGDEELEQQMSSRKEYIDRFFYHFKEEPEEEPEKRLSFSSGFNKLKYLASVMLAALVKNGIYSRDIFEALSLAINEVPELMYLEDIRSFVENENLICRKHLNIEFITMNCGVSHCLKCVFDKIKEEISLNSQVSCLCNKYISADQVAKIKECQKYQEYIRNN